MRQASWARLGGYRYRRAAAGIQRAFPLSFPHVACRRLYGMLDQCGCEPAIRRLHDQHRVPLAPASQVTDMATLLAMVREGLGVSIIPALSLGARHEGIAALPLCPRAPRTLLLGARDADLSPAAGAFHSHVRDAGPPARKAPAPYVV